MTRPKKKGAGLELAVAIGFGLLLAAAFFGFIIWGSS